MKHQITAIVAGLVLSLTVIAAADADAEIETTKLLQAGRGLDDNRTAPTTSQQLPQQQQPPNNQSLGSDTTPTTDTLQHTRRIKRAKAKKKKQKIGRVNGGKGSGGGGCTPDEQRKCCSKYKKPNFHMACKALGCKTTKCPRFYGSRIMNDGDSSSDSDGSSSSEEELSLAQQFASGYRSESISLNDSTSASTSSKDELSLAQQFATMDNDTVNFNNYKNEDNEASPCGESGVCHSSTIQRYDTLISFTYQDGDIVERDCIMYRCRDYPYSLWCTNELYVPGSDNGGIAWERIGPCWWWWNDSVVTYMMCWYSDITCL